MTSFVRGMTFMMDGKEYEVLSEGGSDPSSSLVYAPANENYRGDPQTLRMWKAESRLARGDIMISGYPRGRGQANFGSALDPLEQIAELKKRILELEKSRLTLFRAHDPAAQILLQDNLVRPNKVFEIWAYTAETRQAPIQYIKLRGLLLALSGEKGRLEHFLFNISDQLSPTCRVKGGTLSSEGTIRIELAPGIQTIQGKASAIIPADMDGHIELTMDLRMACQHAIGQMAVYAKIRQAAYIRPINAPGLKTAPLAFPEIGSHMIAIEGISLDIYAEAGKSLSAQASARPEILQ